jgi:hypothetical protein
LVVREEVGNHACAYEILEEEQEEQHTRSKGLVPVIANYPNTPTMAWNSLRSNRHCPQIVEDEAVSVGMHHSSKRSVRFKVQ